MRGTAALFILAACATPVAADTVHLVNGKKFEEVVAQRAAGEVRIRMPHGEIVLPARVVARVERSPSAWRTFDERAAALRDPEAPAGRWLELAIWAEEAGYAEGVRLALLRAAELDPGLEGLAWRMGRLGYVLDREAGRWVAEADYMRQRGYRLWGDRWLPRDEYAARQRAREEREARRREEARQERITRAIEALVVAQLSRAAESEPEPTPAGGAVVAVYPGGYYPFAVAPASPGSAPAPAPAPTAPAQADYDQLAKRQPGSLFPVPQRRRRASRE